MFTFIIQLWQNGKRGEILFITADSFEEAVKQLTGVFNLVETIRND